MPSLHLLIASIILLNYKTTAQSSDPVAACTTPEGHIGKCVSVYACNEYVQYIDEELSLPLSQRQKQYLRGYSCGGGDLNICCAKQSNYANDFTKHKNYDLLPFDCGAQLTNNRVHFGTKTQLGEFPWMALLAYRKQNDNRKFFKCGGTVLNANYILTAAHCVTHLVNGYTFIDVRLGEHNIKTKEDCEVNDSGELLCNDPVQDIGYSGITVHPRFDHIKYTNDIALIRLATPANMTVDNVKPICLPVTKELLKLKLKEMIVAGWGDTEENVQSNVLLKAKLPLVEREKCQPFYQGDGIVITSKMLCAKNVTSDSCSGDSGGPFKTVKRHHNDVRYVQYGIVSFGATKCSRDDRPGVYTKVVNYMEWILDNIKP